MSKLVVIAMQKPFSSGVRERMVNEIQSARLDVSVLEGYADSSELTGAVGDANGLIVRSDRVSADVMQAASNLELVVRAGAGIDNIDVEFAQKRGVIVENTPGQNANAVAELALELMLAALRPLDGSAGKELKGRTLGVHGFGNTGRIVARLGKTCGMSVRVFDMNVDRRSALEYGVSVVESAEELYTKADVVSLHIPDSATTRGSINRHLMLLMAEDAVLVNTARSAIINEKDLLAVLDERPAFRYATDVAPREEMLAEFRQRCGDRLIATPKKQGAQTFEANLNAGLAAARQAVAFFTEGDASLCVYKLIPPHLKEYAKLAVQLGKLNAAFVANPREIHITAYGELSELADTLAEYVLKGLFTSALGAESTPSGAAQYAADRGIETVMREPDNARGYGNALTVDFMADDGSSHGSRGRIDEGQMEASRIGEFKARMPLDPGLYVIATYREGPGMADKVGHLLTDSGYNRVRLGAGPNMDNTRAQAFFQVEKKGLGFEKQLVEVQSIAKQMNAIPDVHDVKVINLNG